MTGGSRAGRAALIGLALAVAWPAASGVAGGLPRYVKLDMPQLVKLVIGWGYPAHGYMTDDGYPEVRAAIAGEDVQVQFYDCTGAKRPRCREFELSAAFVVDGRVTAEQVNGWNSQWRYHAAFVDGASAYLRQDFLLADGLSAEAIREQFAIFATALADFRTFIAPADASAD